MPLFRYEKLYKQAFELNILVNLLENWYTLRQSMEIVRMSP